ncbi:Receptor region, transmembrane domain- and RING domain-containing protein 1, partial [Ananas comosus]
MESVNKLDPLEYCQCCILAHQMDETVGTVLVISLVYLVVIISVIATILFARNCWLLRHGVHIQPPNMKRQAVDVLPCFTFKSAYLNGKRIEETCAICLEDYRDEEMLRILPCLHEFHLACVDSWLTKWGTFCPVCKHEVSSEG